MKIEELALEELGRIAKMGDQERAHVAADEWLERLVRAYVPNGDAIVDAYSKIDKWYA
jgi:hypothetical protein